MKLLLILAALFCYSFTFSGSLKQRIPVVNSNDPGPCKNETHGKVVLVQTRAVEEKVVICVKDKGVYRWKCTDGTQNTDGEFFNPGYDCSDILNKLQSAKDGFYWITLTRSNPRKVWCDMRTNGGGYMLIGRMNNSITWSVPSNDITVEPYGEPHWSSSLGDAPIIDFRVQIATKEDFKTTKAHWSIRLQAPRPLKQLLNTTDGCSQRAAGIGNISYVKDLQTERIVTTKLRCSKFGLAHHFSSPLGWPKMNACLTKPCPSGFTYLAIGAYKRQLDHYGAFSYSTTGSISGMEHNATAFVGCDGTVCCACYGPVGGTKDYCAENCKAINGGTVTKNVFTWFWVRSSLPKRIWNKCMDYEVKRNDGKLVWYKLVGDSVVPVKGRCSKDLAILHDGIVVVPDNSTAKKVPPVDGLLAYRKDKQELYVISNKTWNVVAQKNKVIKKDQYNNDIAQLKSVIKAMNDTLNHLLAVNKDSLFESVILSRDANYIKLLRSWIGKSSTEKLCWWASRDGWAASTFHSKCDNKVPTVTIVKVGNYIFGGYATASWSGNHVRKRAPGSFIFSFRNRENLPPFKAPLKYQNTGLAIYTSPSYGPTFGGGFDLHISNNAASYIGSYTRFNSYYQAPSGVSDRKTILAGTHMFTPTEVEVFYLV